MWRWLKDLWHEPTDAPSDLTAHVHSVAAAWDVAEDVAWHVARQYAAIHDIALPEAVTELAGSTYADAVRETGEV